MENNLEKTIIHDIAEHMKRIMSTQKITFSHGGDDNAVILEYLNVAGKWVLPKSRKVFFSKELQDRVDNRNFSQKGYSASAEEAEHIVNLILHFKDLFQKGADINNHLSTQIFTSKRQDVLFNTWNIKHIHLHQLEVHSKKGMKRNRADFLLFCIVEEEAVYFLDVRVHPQSNEFSSYSFLEIAFQNSWMRHLGFEEIGVDYVPYSMKPQITSDEEIYKLYNDKVNISFDFQGHGYVKIMGIASSGDRIENVLRLNQLKRYICKLDFAEEDYRGFFPNTLTSAAGIIRFQRDGKISEFKMNFDE